MKKVAVITRTKDRPILLARAMESVRGQSFSDLLWVVVNDGGAPQPVERIVMEARRAGLEVQVFHNQESAGMEAASNIGIRNSSSRYVVIHDDDDSWEPEFLAETSAFLECRGGEGYGGVVTHAWKVEERLQDGQCTFLNKSLFKIDDRLLEGVYLSELAKANQFPNNTFLFRREIYDLIGGYDESLPVLGDWDFNLKFLLHANVAVIQRPLANYHYRIQDNISEEYANTVVQGINRHKQYDVILRNHLLREDIRNNRVGLGYLVNLGRDTINLERSTRFIMNKISELPSMENLAGILIDDLTRSIRRAGFWRIFKRLFIKRIWNPGPVQRPCTEGVDLTAGTAR